MLDAGCGEGVIVHEYAGRLAIEGVDANYASAHVRTGSVTALPYAPESFDRALCLDVLEHLTFEEQPRGARASCTACSGRAANFSCRYQTSRTCSRASISSSRAASSAPHRSSSILAIDPSPSTSTSPGARASSWCHGEGIFPTVPVLTRFIRRHPQTLRPLHRALTRLLPIPGWCFLNLLTFRKA